MTEVALSGADAVSGIEQIGRQALRRFRIGEGTFRTATLCRRDRSF